MLAEITEKIELKEEPGVLVEADSSAIKLEVEEIKEVVDEVVTEESLTEKVEALRSNIDSLGFKISNWDKWYERDYAKTLESLKRQIVEVEEEWLTVGSKLQAQGERLDTLLQSFPGVIETTAIKALSLRVTHLEQLVSKIIEEERSKSTAKRANKMFMVSVSSLAITIVLWIIWIALSLRG